MNLIRQRVRTAVEVIKVEVLKGWEIPMGHRAHRRARGPFGKSSTWKGERDHILEMVLVK